MGNIGMTEPFRYWIYWGIIAVLIGICVENLTGNFVLGLGLVLLIGLTGPPSGTVKKEKRGLR